MLKINGTITKIIERDTKIGKIKEYTIADAGVTFRVTDFSGLLADYEETDLADIAVRAKSTIYDGKAYIQYTC